MNQHAQNVLIFEEDSYVSNFNTNVLLSMKKMLGVKALQQLSTSYSEWKIIDVEGGQDAAFTRINTAHNILLYIFYNTNIHHICANNMNISNSNTLMELFTKSLCFECFVDDVSANLLKKHKVEWESKLNVVIVVLPRPDRQINPFRLAIFATNPKYIEDCKTFIDFTISEIRETMTRKFTN